MVTPTQSEQRHTIAAADTTWSRLEQRLARSGGAWMLACGLLAAAISFAWTRAGATIPSGDSIAYLESGRTLLKTGSYGWVTWTLGADGQALPGGFELNTIWAPGLSAALSGLMALGLEIQTAARLLVIVCAGLATAFAFGVVRLVTGSVLAALCLTLVTLGLFTYQFWVIESWMAEGIYMAAVFIGIVIFHRAASAPRLSIVSWLVLGLGCSGVYYVKSIGVSFVVAVGISVLLLRRFSLGERMRAAVCLAVGCGLGAAPWILRNLSTGTVGGAGSPVPHPILLSVIEWFRLFVPRYGPFMESHRALGLMAAFALALAGMLAALVLPSGCVARARSFLLRIEAAGPGAILATVYLATFTGMVAVAVMLKKTGWFETRYWMEVAPLMLALGWLAVQSGLQSLSGTTRKALQISALACLAVIVAANVLETLKTISYERISLPTEAHRSAARTELARLVDTRETPVFLSNQIHRFGVETGLTAWRSVSDRPTNANGRNPTNIIYVSYPTEPDASMALVPNPPAVPPGWRKVGMFGPATLFSPR